MLNLNASAEKNIISYHFGLAKKVFITRRLLLANEKMDLLLKTCRERFSNVNSNKLKTKKSLTSFLERFGLKQVTKTLYSSISCNLWRKKLFDRKN